MSMRSDAPRASIRAVLLSMGVALAGTAAGLPLSSSPAQALPTSCILRTYYSDAAMTEMAGSWSNCPGNAGLTGRRTRYFEDDRVELGGPKPIGGGGGLPCEFRQENDPLTGKPLTDYSISQCYNLPIMRP